jgi:hypothetical protein
MVSKVTVPLSATLAVVTVSVPVTLANCSASEVATIVVVVVPDLVSKVTAAIDAP